MPINCYNVFRRKAILRFVEKKIMSLENKDIKQIIGDNIAFLRKNNHWTQAELADKLNYSDKAISKWERGESSPDPDIMLKLSELFYVRIDYFYHEGHNEEFVNTSNRMNIRNILVVILLCVGIYFIATSVFLLATLRDNSNASKFWISFIAAVPFCGLINFMYFKRINNRIGRIISASVVLWGIITTIVLIMFYRYSYAWMLFIIGAPIEAAINLYEFIRN